MIHIFIRELTEMKNVLNSIETTDSRVLTGVAIFSSMVLSLTVGNYLPGPPFVTGIAVLVMFMCLFVFFAWILNLVEKSIEPDLGVLTGVAFFISMVLSLILGRHLTGPSNVMGIEVLLLFLCFFVLFGWIFHFVGILWPDNYSPST